MIKQKNQIIGSFVFRNEGNGCLTSKFQHGNSKECPFTEACKLKNKEKINKINSFYGIYRTVWLQDNNAIVNSDLLIEEHPENPDLFKLTWHKPDKPNDIIFWGSGMIFENLLVGAYWT